MGTFPALRAGSLKQRTPMELLQDNYIFGGVDSGKWSTWGIANGFGVNATTNLDLEITSCSGANTGYGGTLSLRTYDLTSSYAFQQLIDAASQVSGLEVYPVELSVGNNALSIMVAGNLVYARRKINGSYATVGSTVAYNSTTMKWFRVREADGVIYWEYAADPTSTWTIIAQDALINTPFAITALIGGTTLGTWSVVTQTTAKFGNFNVLPNQYQFSWKGFTWNKRIHIGDPTSNTPMSVENVSLPDANNYLTFTLSNPNLNNPVGTEIFSDQRGFGYGTYIVVIGSELDTLDHRVGWGGLFTFDFTAPPDYKEIDVDETRDYGGNAAIQLLHTVTWNNAGVRNFNVSNQNIDPSVPQTHRLIWSPGKVQIDSFAGIGVGGTLLFSTTVTTNVPTPGLERVHFNIWNNNAVANYQQVPTTNVVVQDFTFIPNRYWIGGTGNWSDTAHWSATPGGAGGASVPTNGNNVFFESHSFSAASQIVTIDANATCNDIDFTGVTNTPQLNFNGFNLDVYGSLTFVSGMTLAQTGGPYLRFKGTSGTQLIDTGGKTIPTNVDFNGVGGTFKLTSAFTASNTFVLHQAGTLNLNGQTFTPSQYSNNGSSSALTLTMGASAVNPTGDFRMNGSSATVNAGTSTITMAGGTFDGGGKTYATVVINGTTTIVGSNTFTNFTINAGKTCHFTVSTTQTMTTFTAIGSAGNVITIDSTTAGTQATLSQASGTVNSDYLSLKDSNATGGATWFPGAHSTNVSNNTGWIWGTNYTSTLTDTISLSEVFTKLTTKVFTDSVSLSEVFIRSTTKVFTESTSLVEAFIRFTTKVFVETISLVETFIRFTTKVFTESLSLIETFIKQPQKVFSESVTPTDSMTYLKTQFRTFTDTITLSEVFIRNTTKAFVESLSLVEAFLKQPQKVFTGSITLTETMTKMPGKAFSETISLVETFIRATTKVFSETITLSETFVALKAFFKTVTDSVTISDSITKFTTKALSESVSILETINKFFSKGITDTVSLNDTMVKLVKKSFVETPLSLIESFTKVLITTTLHTLLLTDTIVLTETFTKAVSKRFIDTISLLESFRRTVTGEWLKIQKAIAIWTKINKPPV